MLRVRLEDSRVLNDPRYLSPGARLYTTDEQKLGIKITSNQCRVTKPNGDLLFMLVKDVIPHEIWYPAYQLLRTVSGNLSKHHRFQTPTANHAERWQRVELQHGPQSRRGSVRWEC